jgi:hypothetical protein
MSTDKVRRRQGCHHPHFHCTSIFDAISVMEKKFDKKYANDGDNGPHFHCTSIFDAISVMEKKFGIELEIDFFEVGEGKSDLDRHFGSTKQSIRTRVRNGKSLSGSLEELLTAVAECTTNTRVYEIQPERKQKEEFYHSYKGTNPIGSLATGEEFFCYEFGSPLLKIRKGSKPVSTEEVYAPSPSVVMEVEIFFFLLFFSSSSSTSTSSSLSKNCSICGEPSGKSQRHRACMAKERELKVCSPPCFRYQVIIY